MDGEPIAPERRHTLFFLHEVRAFAPVFIDTEVDMTTVLACQAAAGRQGTRYSVVSYVLWSVGRVLAEHPEANAAIRGRLRPRVLRHSTVNAKVALDKTMGGQRVALSAVLRDIQRATLDDIQRQVAHYRDGDPERMPEFAAVRRLHRRPWLSGLRRFRKVARPLGKRAYVFGTVAVTSLGHRPVDGFHSVGGTTITLGLGRVVDRPVVRAGEITVAPVMRLNLAFDHRVIDGAEAADVLAALKQSLESFTAEPATVERSAALIADQH
jgi:pyruvate/2-oxoglutarate dehydrogenase complex dihydrolipoamide acyltransferase (E2) component